MSLGASVVAEDQLLEIVNSCRKALNSFFCSMTLQAQMQGVKTFASLKTFSEVSSANVSAKPLGDGPATFIGPTELPKNRSDVVMPDIAAAWGFSTLRRFTQQEIDELGSTAIGQVLEMLEKGQPMGVDTRLERLLHDRGGIATAKYRVQWHREGIQRTELPNDLGDNRGCVAASRHILRIPLLKHNVRQGMCQDDETKEPPECQDPTDDRVKVFYHGTPLLSAPSILAFGLQASPRSHSYVGLRCRENVEQALKWCICPEVQHFPCVALELAAWNNTQEGGEENGNILNNRKHMVRPAYKCSVQEQNLSLNGYPQ